MQGTKAWKYPGTKGKQGNEVRKIPLDLPDTYLTLGYL